VSIIQPAAVHLGSSKVTQHRKSDGSLQSEYEINIMDNITTKRAKQSNSELVLGNRKLGSWQKIEKIALEEATSPRSNKMYVIAVVPH
jgi:hypothetical protein